MYAMEGDWWQIDGEWGSTPGGIETAISRGECPEISSIRAFVAKAKSTKTGVKE